MKIIKTTTPLKLLHFDIENRPLSYWYDGNCTAEVTAIAWSWSHEEEVHCMALGEYRWVNPGMPNEYKLTFEVEDLLFNFCEAYDQADIVTGHYIRKHDLPIINGALLELSMPLLGPKLASDTKMDLPRISGLPASQEALCAMYGVDTEKYHMTQTAWREANRLSSRGVSETKKRVIDDVKQHKELRAVLVAEGVLKPPKAWRP